MNEILTADQFARRFDLLTLSPRDLMVEFAKYHVQQALIAAIDVPLLDHTEDNIELVNSILNAYDLNNIK